LDWLGSRGADVAALWCQVWSVECSDNCLSVSHRMCSVHSFNTAAIATTLWAFCSAAAKVQYSAMMILSNRLS